MTEPAAAPPQPSHREPNVVATVFVIVRTLAMIAAGLALADLAVRAAIRLDSYWDSSWYHLPIAARRAGISIPYELLPRIKLYYQGFPPLPELVQGVLWRITGTINAAGVVNYLAALGFLVYCHRVLRAAFWLVALIVLTAPLVVIHAASCYVDLFANSFLAMSAASCLFMVLFPERTSRRVVMGGLAGATVAAWSKLQLVPLAALFLVLVTVLAWRRRTQTGVSRRRIIAIHAAAAIVAAVPYIKNLVVYGNPVWPVRAPLVGGAFPYAFDGVADGVNEERPEALRDTPQAVVFVRSLFEVDNPTANAHEPRWSVDQKGEAPPPQVPAGFRMGGFWGIGVVFYLIATLALFVLHDRRRGLVAVAGALAVLGLVAVLPQSNELRYYMFLPLTWAAGFGMTFPGLYRRAPRLALAALVTVIALFGYMVSENRGYYAIESRGPGDVAREGGADKLWPMLHPETTYCATHAQPFGFWLTGPTQTEFEIVDRMKAVQCPEGSFVFDARQTPSFNLATESSRLMRAGRLEAALRTAEEAIAFDATTPAWKTECAALCELARWDRALAACERAVRFRARGAVENLERARAHLRNAIPDGTLP